MIEPIVVHFPRSWSKLRKLIKRLDGSGKVPIYPTVCGGEVELPEAVVVRRDEDGAYFVAGPHERYFVVCERCAS